MKRYNKNNTEILLSRGDLTLFLYSFFGLKWANSILKGIPKSESSIDLTKLNDFKFIYSDGWNRKSEIKMFVIGIEQQISYLRGRLKLRF